VSFRFDVLRTHPAGARLGRMTTAHGPVDTPTFMPVATHGSVWDYDRRVPILFWRPGSRSQAVERTAETTDILPTLAASIGLPIRADSIDGHCLAEAPATTCPR